MAIITEKIKEKLALSLKIKTGVIYFIAIFAALTAVGFFIVGTVSGGLYDNETTDAFSKANILARTISDLSSEDDYGNVMSDSLAGSGLRGILLDGSGLVIYDTNDSAGAEGIVFTSSLISGAFFGEQQSEISKTSNGGRLLTVAVPIKSGSNVSGVVYLTKELGNVQRLISSLRRGYIICFFAIMIIVGLLCANLGNLMTSPLNEFVVTAREISKGNFDKRIAPKKNHEMDQLASALNYMCAELGHLETKRKKFVSDASHELKTPMATIKLICDSITATEKPDMEMVKDFLSDLSEEVDRLTRIIEKLLLLSKLDTEEIQISPELVDFGMMLQRIKNKLEPMAVSKNITVTLDIQEDIPPVVLDYDRLWESIYNIVDNAIKYSKIGSIVKITAAVVEKDLIVRIYDSGRGIPDEFKERVFERFYRLDDSRARDTGGTGLGLSIAKEAVLLHNGQLYVEDNPEGGSCFVVKLPISSDPIKK